jgi:hypothetical protein
LPNIEVKTVGHYLRPETARPGVFLQRAGDNLPWTVLRSGQAISTARNLLSLPGYESLVSLRGGMRLNLWGSVPEFQSPKDMEALVFESAVMFNNPEEGVALDLILDRGRVEIDLADAEPGARVRLRFLREVWDVGMLDKGSKLCAELWQVPPEKGGGWVFGLFSRGKVTINTGRKKLHFSSPARIAWISARPGELFQQELSSPPAWWAKPPEPTNAAKEAFVSLIDWASKLDKATEVVPTILAFIHDSPDRADQLRGLRFLAALDQVSHLVGFLGEKLPETSDIRREAMVALKICLDRNEQLRESLPRLLVQHHGFGKDEARLLVSLLSSFSEEACKDPATYQALISNLNHIRLEIRHLAAYHLYEELAPRLPRKALDIDYRPTDDEKKRLAAVAKWRKIIPEGRLPVPPAR